MPVSSAIEGGDLTTPSREFVALSMESPEAADLPEVAQDLLFRYPGCETTVHDGRVVAFHSTRMTRGATPEDAERAFWAEHAEAFGVSGLNLTLTRSHEIAGGKFTVFAYKQRIDGLPVEYSSARVLVRNGPECAVVYAAGKFVPPPGRPFAPIAVPPKSAASLAGAGGPYKHLDAWTPPELVVFGGQETQWGNGPDKFGDPVRAWRFSGRKTSPGGVPEAYTFYVDASTGSLLHVQSDVHHFDVTGHVSANATLVVPSGNPGEWWNWARPDSGSNYGLVDMPNIRVRIEGTDPEAYAYTDADGMFAIPHNGTEGIQLRVDTVGQWFNVNTLEDGGVDYSFLTQTGSPLDPWAIELNSPAAEYVTAQMNGLLYANAMRQLFDWTGLDEPLVIEVNSNSSDCNGYFYSTGRLEFNGPPDCPVNTAFSSVVSHEYGHFIVHRLGLAQGAFGEGFSDACALLLTDDPWFGRGPDDTNPSAGRNYEPGEVEYPYPCPTGSGQLCPGGPAHCCCRILGGLWWDIREWFHDGAGEPADPFPDDEAALAYARDLFVAWALMTQGGSGTASAHPLTGIEILTVDDDDGNIWNGTPHSDDIEKALDAHQIPLTPGLNPPPVVTFEPPLNWKTSIPNDPIVGIDPFAIAPGHLNNDIDLIPDIVLTCEGSGNVLVYLGAGYSSTSYSVQPGLAIPLGTGSRPAKVVLAHMKFPGEDVDDLLDIVVTLQGRNAVQIIKNEGGGVFEEGVLIDFDSNPQVANPIGLVVDDFDGNGFNDIAVAGYQDISQGVTHPVLGLAWTNSDGSRSKAAVLVPLGSVSSRGLDLCACASIFISGYGANQLAMTSESTTQVFIFNYVSSPTPGFTYDPNTGPISAVASPGICAADFNADHKVDLACSDYGNFGRSVRWIKQTAFGVFTLQSDDTPVNQLPRSLAAGKLSKKAAYPLTLDARIDIVVGRQEGDDETRVLVLANTGNQSDLFAKFEFAVSPVITEYPNPRGVAVWDMNADGFPDVITANAGSNLTGNDATEGFSVLLNRTQ